MQWINYSGGSLLRDGSRIVGTIIQHKGDAFDAEGHRTYYHWDLTDGSNFGSITGYYPGKARAKLKEAYLKSKEQHEL
jgi:hypothetical protein